MRLLGKQKSYIMNLTNLVLNFYATLSIPLFYFLILGVITFTPATFPLFLKPAMLLLAQPTIRILNLIITFSGIILWLWSYLALGKQFGVLPGNKVKVTRGPYKWLQHPMYLGIFLTFTGLSLATLSIPGLSTNWFLLTPINWYRAKKEAQLLRN